LARVRVRQHVNPLSYKYRTPITLPNWSEIYQNLTQPLHLDIGCARGKFLLKMASLYPDMNFLGTEIREPLVIEANENRDQLGLTNLHFLFCNINISLSAVLDSFPEGVLKWVTIQFPDPWFKQRHLKRRVVQPELVQILADYIQDSGMILLQSDVKIVAQEMSDNFSECPYFIKQHSQPWLDINPLPVATEREIATFNKQEPVYRVLYKKV
jgi:tRNA (guanine-N7-)-methyltransferase